MLELSALNSCGRFCYGINGLMRSINVTLSMRFTSLCLFSVLALSGRVSARDPQIGKFEPAACPVRLPDASQPGETFEFGYVTVPEQHTQPTGPGIRLAVARFRSHSPDPLPDPFIANTGGPGDSNLDQFLPTFSGPLGTAILSERDIVVIELRGLRYSQPALICNEVYQAQTGMVEKDIKADEANQILLSAMRGCYDRFIARGINLSAFNNVETAADIALVMDSLGYEKFNLFGSSAGTMVAQYVMRDYPGRLRSVVLNAAVPSGVPFLRNMPMNAAESLERLFRLCRKDEMCRSTYPDMEQKFFAFLARLNREPVTIPVTNPATGEKVQFVLNGDRLSSWIFTSMYFNTQIIRSLSRMMAGEYSELQKSAHIFFPMKNFAYGLSYTIFSTEQMDFGVEDTRVEGPYAAYVDGFSMFFNSRLQAMAREFWKVAPLHRALLKPLQSEIPTLILNGQMDHVLPAKQIEKITSGLSNGYLYIFPGVAHSPVDAGSCGLQMTMEFVGDPSKAPDSGCLAEFKHTFVIGGQ